VFAYNAQVGCDKHGWVLAYSIDAGNVHDSQAFLALFEQLERLQSDYLIADSGYKTPSIAKFLLDQNIIGVVCGYGEDTDFVFSKEGGDFGQYPNERKIQSTLYPESLPTIIAFYGIVRRVGCFAHEGYFFIGFSNEVKVLIQVNRIW